MDRDNLTFVSGDSQKYSGCVSNTLYEEFFSTLTFAITEQIRQLENIPLITGTETRDPPHKSVQEEIFLFLLARCSV